MNFNDENLGVIQEAVREANLYGTCVWVVNHPGDYVQWTIHKTLSEATRALEQSLETNCLIVHPNGTIHILELVR